MFSFFLNTRLNNNVIINTHRNNAYVKKIALDNINTIKNYYKDREFRVDNHHYLVRLIKHISPDVNIAVDKFISIAMNTVAYYSKTFDIVSDINYGNSTSNILYGYNSTEIFLYVEKTFIDYYNMDACLSTSAIKCIYSEDGDCNMWLPDGSKELDERVLSVYQIDLVHLVLQYKLWCDKRVLVDSNSTDVAVFITQLVLPNLIPSIFNIATINLFLGNYYNPVKLLTEHEYNFALSNQDTMMSTCISEKYDELSNSNITLETLLMNIPMFLNSNALDALRIDKEYYTTQSEWALWLSRIFYIDKLLTTMGSKGISKNTGIVYTTRMVIKKIESKNTKIKNRIPPIIYDRYVNSISNIKNVVGK